MKRIKIEISPEEDAVLYYEKSAECKTCSRKI